MGRGRLHGTREGGIGLAARSQRAGKSSADVEVHAGNRTVADGAVSVAPDGEIYPVPGAEEAAAAFRPLEQRAREARAQGRRVVVVQGLGFVGSAVAAVIASATDAESERPYFVIGVDLPSEAGYWKVAKINAGVPPISSTSSELAELTRSAVHERKTLSATTCEEAYALADVIVVDVHLDAAAPPSRDPLEIRVDLESFRAAVRTVGRRMRPDALVIVETTVPVGTTEHVVLAALTEERRARGIEEPVLLAHAYERVMPGAGYVDSIRAYPRAYSGVDEPSAAAAGSFLSTFVRTADGDGLRRLADPTSSELAKLLENSYRATNIALIQEWTLLAEDLGVNLFEVVEAIRLRKGTHDNIRNPGFGVGGYCLTKDSLLAQWGARQLFGSEVLLGMTLDALRTNAAMPLHTARLAREAAGELKGATVAVCGVSYIPDVADTRNSPSEVLVDELLAAGAVVRVHDPSVRTWPERPELPIIEDLGAALRDVDGVVLAVPHAVYGELAATILVDAGGAPGFVVDAQDVVSDAAAERLYAAGWRVLGVGKGHWRKRGLDRPAASG